MASIEIALTFDEGPDGLPGVATPGDPKRYNSTERILTYLDSPGDAWPEPIKAAFFVQTHVPERMGSQHGKDLVRRAHANGHVIGIHSGSTRDRDDHLKQKNEGTLDANLDSAKTSLAALLPSFTPAFVRGPAGLLDSNLQTYQTRGLRPVFWDVEGFDMTRRESGDPPIETYIGNQVYEVVKNIRGTAQNIKAVVQFNDTSFLTACLLPQFIKGLIAGGRGRTKGELPVEVRFCRSTSDVVSALQNAPSSSSLRKDPVKNHEFVHKLDEGDEPVLMSRYLTAFEKFVGYLYLDTEGNVTVGTGHHVKNANDMDTIEMQKNGISATNPQKHEEWQAIKDMDFGPRIAAPAFKGKGPHKLTMADAVGGDLLRVDRVTLGIDPAVRIFGDAYSTAPLAARLGIVDMIFNLGAKKFKSQFVTNRRSFGPAVRARNWKTAANENKRKPPVPSQRNDFTKRLFEAADELDHRPVILAVVRPPQGEITAVPAVSPVQITLVLAPGWTLDAPFSCTADIVYEEHQRKDITAPFSAPGINTLSFSINVPAAIIQGGVIRVKTDNLKLKNGNETRVLNLTQHGLVKGVNPPKSTVRTTLGAINGPVIGQGPALIDIGLVYQAIAYHASAGVGAGATPQTAFHLFDEEGKPRFQAKPKGECFGLLRLPLSEVNKKDGPLLWHWRKQADAAAIRMKAIDAAVSRAVAAVRARDKGAPALSSKEHLLECLHRYGQEDADSAKTLLLFRWNRSTEVWTPLPVNPVYANEVLDIHDHVKAGNPPPGWT